MLFGKDPRLAPIRIPHTATEETTVTLTITLTITITLTLMT